MPTYSYECKKCGKIQDEFHSITANPRVKCNKCGGPCKRKLGKGSGIIFKGSGFYETDYKRAGSKGGDGKAESAGGEKAAESKSETKAETKTETKTETKPESKPEPTKASKSASKSRGSGKSSGKRSK